MFLQGNLQIVFDALYNLGIIDPVLKMDWSKALEEVQSNPRRLQRAVSVANDYQQNPQELKEKLEAFDQKTLSYLAMEVARELASFHTRKTLH